MILTREQAVVNHRKMWNWIADETLKQKKRVEKKEYFNFFGIALEDTPKKFCYCCEFADFICYRCPIDWSPKRDCCDDGLFAKWLHCKDYKEASILARQIAELPEV